MKIEWENRNNYSAENFFIEDEETGLGLYGYYGLDYFEISIPVYMDRKAFLRLKEMSDMMATEIKELEKS